MSLGKVGRKLKRVGKTAAQFRFTSTFEYIDLKVKGVWRPDNLRVVWLRNHRKVRSTDVQWVATEDRGPNGAEGRATFNPTISVALIVTLYKDGTQGAFQEKEYKYYLENNGPNGKKILASFHCDMAEYTGIPTAEHTLDMNFKPVSVKVQQATLGITLKSEFIKQGSAIDDDMQSTFSAMSAGTNTSLREDETDDEEDMARKLSAVEEDIEIGTGGTNNKVLQSLLVLGTGEEIKRNSLPSEAPPKPSRNGSIKTHNKVVIPLAVDQLTNPSQLAKNDPLLNGQTNEMLLTNQIPESHLTNQMVISPATNQIDQPSFPITNGIHTSIEKVYQLSDKVDQSRPYDKEAGDKEILFQSVPKKADEVGKYVTVASENMNGSKKEKKELTATPLKESKQKEVVTSNQNGSISQTESSVKDTHKSINEDTGNRQETTCFNAYSEARATPTVNGHCSAEKQESSSTDKQDTGTSLNGESTGESHEQKCNASDNTRQVNSTLVEPKESPVKQSTCNAEENNSAESLIESTEPKRKPDDRDEASDVLQGRGFDYVFEAARSLAQMRKTSEAAKTENSEPVRREVQSQDEYQPPPNPYLEDSPLEQSMEPPSPTAAWLGEDTAFVDCFGEAVRRQKLDRADIIALYFSASWCPPCRRFLPKLVKFYHHIKQHAKSFEILYISSDYSKQDMMKYMQQQQMPWVGLAFEGDASQNLQKLFNVTAIPQLKIVTKSGEMIEESAKKPVEATNSGADVLRLYNKWHERVGSTEPEHEAKEKGILQKVKKAIKGKDRSGSRARTETVDSSVSPAALGSPLSKSKEDLAGSSRTVVQNRSRNRSTPSAQGKSKDTVLEEKEEQIRHLQEVNMTLKQTNDELNEEVTELKRQLSELQTRMEQIEQTSKKLERDKQDTIAKLSTSGWLYKRGIKGPTANFWRRRYFRCDQGSKIFYYKNSTEGTPQGFIDLTKLISVQEVSPAQQDKNNATFLVQCDGRTYQLLAHDEATMRKWMSAIEYLSKWHKTNTLSTEATP